MVVFASASLKRDTAGEDVCFSFSSAATWKMLLDVPAPSSPLTRRLSEAAARMVARAPPPARVSTSLESSSSEARVCGSEEPLEPAQQEKIRLALEAYTDAIVAFNSAQLAAGGLDAHAQVERARLTAELSKNAARLAALEAKSEAPPRPEYIYISCHK